ncbi:MAG: cobalamin-dependent protein, partial [Bacteroidota bacterium]
MNDISPAKIRIVTATSLFDGHDAAINIMRRILQSKGVEIIHLGHNRSVHEIVECAIEEDARGIAVTSYQGGHVEFFKYMKDLLDESGCGHIKIFGGGGGTILPQEINELHHYGISKIYSPDDGRRMGLEGMIEEVIKLCAAPPVQIASRPSLSKATPSKTAANTLNGNHNTIPGLSHTYALQEWKDIIHIGQAITKAENQHDYATLLQQLRGGSNAVSMDQRRVVLGITGTGGAGKSSITDEMIRRFLQTFTDKTIAVISVDPSKKKTGGALLGDRIRMNAISHPRAYMRSLATRADNASVSRALQDAIDICRAAAFDSSWVRSSLVEA